MLRNPGYTYKLGRYYTVVLKCLSCPACPGGPTQAPVCWPQLPRLLPLLARQCQERWSRRSTAGLANGRPPQHPVHVPAHEATDNTDGLALSASSSTLPTKEPCAQQETDTTSCTSCTYEGGVICTWNGGCRARECAVPGPDAWPIGPFVPPQEVPVRQRRANLVAATHHKASLSTACTF